jgi:hypothetical protein
MAALQITPTPLGLDRDPRNEQAARNTSPLFAMVNSNALRRTNVNNLDDHDWTGNWWVSSTLWLLRNNYSPGPPRGYPLPPTTSPAVDPNGWKSNHSVPPNWENGARVRYAVSFVAEVYESDPGPWCGYVTVMDQAYPALTGIALGPAGTLGRRIYRQFQDRPFTYVGEIPNNTATRFEDNLP